MRGFQSAWDASGCGLRPLRYLRDENPFRTEGDRISQTETGSEVDVPDGEQEQIKRPDRVSRLMRFP